MDISIYVASAFSKNHQGGNKAGVVLNEETLTRTQKMAIAKRLGYAETAFISTSKVADYQLTYFTPKEEVDLCGHATIGAFTILKYLNKLSGDCHTIETNSGVLTVTEEDGGFFMEQNPPTFYDIIPTQTFSDCFDTEAIDSTLPIQIVSTGLKDILIPIKSEAQLQALRPDFEHIKRISQQYDVVGMHLYAFNGDRIICRNFAPRYDINEEAATGTSNGALACYLQQQQRPQQMRYVFEQGETLASPSEIQVALITNDQQDITTVSVGGQGYYCETKHLDVNSLE